LGVVMINKTRVRRIDTRSLLLDCEGAEVSIEADTVILASGARANPDLAERLRATGMETHSIGDCEGVSYIHGAMHSGHAVGRTL
jgi:NADH dehydrogenase FAD-containing subunit